MDQLWGHQASNYVDYGDAILNYRVGMILPEALG